MPHTILPCGWLRAHIYWSLMAVPSCAATVGLGDWAVKAACAARLVMEASALICRTRGVCRDHSSTEYARQSTQIGINSATYGSDSDPARFFESPNALPAQARVACADVAGHVWHLCGIAAQAGLRSDRWRIGRGEHSSAAVALEQDRLGWLSRGYKTGSDDRLAACWGMRHRVDKTAGYALASPSANL